MLIIIYYISNGFFKFILVLNLIGKYKRIYNIILIVILEMVFILKINDDNDSVKVCVVLFDIFLYVFKNYVI